MLNLDINLECKIPTGWNIVDVVYIATDTVEVAVACICVGGIFKH